MPNIPSNSQDQVFIPSETIARLFDLDLAPSSLPPIRVLLGLCALVAFVRIAFHWFNRISATWVYPPASSRLADLLRPSLSFASRGFLPTPWLLSGHLQTLFAAIIANSGYPEVRYTRETVRARDGGSFTLDWAVIPGGEEIPPPGEETPVDDARGKKDIPTIVILHGLTGGSQEAYIKSLVAQNLKGKRYRCVVFNARGCAGSQLETPQFFCASYTNDLRRAVRRIQEVVGDAPMVAIGYSLGSNILVKYLGEEGQNTPFIAAVSVGNPFDLMTAMLGLDRRWFYRNTYSKTLASNLKRAFLRHKTVFDDHPEVDTPHILQSETVYDFDDRFTRKLFGYPSVRHYYRDSSSDLYVNHVAIPLLCLQAEDDPISIPDGIPFEGIATNPFATLVLTNSGGHIGWFSGLLKPEPWSSVLFLKFFDDIFEAHRKGTLQKLTRELREKHSQFTERISTLRSKFLPELRIPEESGASTPAESEPSPLSESSDSLPSVLNDEKEIKPVFSPPLHSDKRPVATPSTEKHIETSSAVKTDADSPKEVSFSSSNLMVGAALIAVVSLAAGFFAGRRRRML